MAALAFAAALPAWVSRSRPAPPGGAPQSAILAAPPTSVATAAAPALRAPSLLAGSLHRLQRHQQPADQAVQCGGLDAAPSWWRAARALELADAQELQDVAASMVLSEAVYRAVEHSPEQAEVAIQRLQRQLPAAPRLSRVQWSPPGQEQRYVVAESADALYVAFLGTKLARDHLVNLRVACAPVLPTPAAAAHGLDRSSQPAVATAAAAAAAARAHGGYLARAAGIPAEQLLQLARVQGKRLVLTGHSLGGAVAQLCAARLLAQLPTDQHAALSCIAFAAPPAGSAGLAAVSEAHGWSRHMVNFVLEEDWVPGLLGAFAAPPAGSEPPDGPTHERVCWGCAEPRSRSQR